MSDIKEGKNSRSRINDLQIAASAGSVTCTPPNGGGDRVLDEVDCAWLVSIKVILAADHFKPTSHNIT
jgi:hypothetical protein